MVEPLVTVICTTYNHGKYVKDALDGFVMQETTFPFKVIVHDDASTDNTSEIIHEYEQEHNGLFECIYQTKNQYSLIGMGIYDEYISPHVQGKYVAYCEGDDFWIDPHKLQTEFDYMESHPECAQCCHAYNKIKANSKIIISVNRSAKESRNLSVEELIMYNNPPQLCTQLFRREVYESEPEFMKISKVGDYPLILKSIMFGTVHYIDKVMSSYRVSSDGSWSERIYCDLSLQNKHWLNMIEILEKFNSCTEYTYKEYVDKKIDIFRFHLLKNNQDYKEIIRRSFFTLAQRTERIEILIGLLSPEVALWIKKKYKKLKAGK